MSLGPTIVHGPATMGIANALHLGFGLPPDRVEPPKRHPLLGLDPNDVGGVIEDVRDEPQPDRDRDDREQQDGPKDDEQGGHHERPTLRPASIRTVPIAINVISRM